MAKKSLSINLFGACIVKSSDASKYEITSPKHRALIVLLATAPYGRRTRSFLQECLWATACYDTGRQSLRRALSDLRKQMGDDFDHLISTNNTDVSLDVSRVQFLGAPGSGLFLEGLDLREELFNKWLTSIRQNPSQLASLFSPSRQSLLARAVPAVTILPFRQILGDPQLGLLSDWMAEEVSRTLSRSNLIAVISHASSRAFGSRLVDIGQVSNQLGVDYCLTGTMRNVGDILICDADFIDVATGRILWTRNFQGKLHDFMAVASKGVAEIAGAIGRAIAENGMAYVQQKPLEELDDQHLLIAAAELMHRPTLNNFAKANKLIDRAIERMPSFAEVHAWKGKWHILKVFNNWSEKPEKDTQLAIDCTARALDLNPDNAFCLTIDGFAHNNLLKRLDIASERYDLALANNPNESLSWLLKGTLHAFRDEADDALTATDQAMKLSPIDPFSYFYDSLNASAHLAGGHYEKALMLADRSLEKNDRHLSTIRARLTALHYLGRDEDARVCAKELMRKQPDCTVQNYLDGHPSGDFKLGKSVAEAMKASGIPQGL